MSLNTAHLHRGILLYGGEQIILFTEHIHLIWSGNEAAVFKGKKKGNIYFTTHRVIFLNKSSKDEMQSFSFPFVTLSKIQVEQPIFGANYVKGKVCAQPNGNWIGSANFKLSFKHGGAIEFGEAMEVAASLASMGQMQIPPPYVAIQIPINAILTASPASYAPAQDYHGWVPPTGTFPDQPPADGVYMVEAPPPYPGITQR